MRTERQIAELVFDFFRNTKCRAGHCVLMRTFRFGLQYKLNPVEQDYYATVINGLLNLKYLKYLGDAPEALMLTEKGYRYIYDDDKKQAMLNTPWLIPNVNNPNWDAAFNRFFTYVNSNDWHDCIEKDIFYNLIKEINPNIPKTLEGFMAEVNTRPEETYKALIELLNTQQRFVLYLNLQYYCEQKSLN